MGDGFWDLYLYYFSNPSKMDRGLYIAWNVSWSVAAVAGGGAAGIVGGTYIAGVLAPSLGCSGATIIGGAAGSTIGGQVGGAIGSIGGDTPSQIGRIGGSIIGGMIEPPCFAAGTPIMTPDGAKPIEQLRAGDVVLSSPEGDANGPVAARRVEEVFHRDSPLYDIQVGGRLIRTTPEHPFYVEGKGWTPAKSLVAGDLLRSHDGRWLPVESARISGEVAPVYNLRVADDHTYFVGSAEEWGFSVWVHNSCDPNEPWQQLHPEDPIREAHEMQEEMDAWQRLRDALEREGRFGEADHAQQQMDFLKAQIWKLFE